MYEKLRAVVDLVLPLTLVDRRSPDFRPDNCRTYHDLTCFAHEKAMQTMLGLMDQVAAGRVPALKLLQLKTDLPLNLHLVDLGDVNHALMVNDGSISGQWLSPHYSDLHQVWLKGDYLPSTLDPEEIKATAKYHMVLMPQ